MKIVLKTAFLFITLFTFSCTQIDVQDVLPEETTTNIGAENRIAPPCFNPTNIEQSIICGNVDDPVCACNTITFRNGCEADKWGFINYTDGPCVTQPCPNPALKEAFEAADIQCGEIYAPVCGCDGKTYGNDCEAMANGVAVFTPGECNGLNITRNAPCWGPDDVDLTVRCPVEVDPVCACGVATFANACEAERMGFSNYTPGACQSSSDACPNDALADAVQTLDFQCADVYQPVCGCDGVTYSNYCYAIGNGVVAFVPGECDFLGTIIQAK